jgi:hypothetical protein
VAGRPAALQAQRDWELEPVRQQLAAWLDEQPPDPVTPGITGGEVRQWRSAGQFAELARRWRQDVPTGAANLAAQLEAWRVRDRHLWEWQANERHQIGGRRDDAWRRVAAWLATHAGQLVMDSMDLAVLRRREFTTDPMLPGHLRRASRARAALASPGRLRDTIEAAARRRGVPVTHVDTAYLTRTCPSCRVAAEAHPRYAAAAVVTCPLCGHAYDQDRSAAALLLQRFQSGGNF